MAPMRVIQGTAARRRQGAIEAAYDTRFGIDAMMDRRESRRSTLTPSTDDDEAGGRPGDPSRRGAESDEDQPGA